MTTQSSELQIAVEEPRTWARRLTITVPAERIQRERREVAKRLAKRVKLPGFRKGRVPASVMERRYGAAIDQEMLERVVGDAYREALQEKGFQPISQAEVDNVDYSPGADLTFNVEFEVKPEIELERVGGFTIERETPEVTDEEVERVLERVREEHAVWQPLEDETPTTGDMVSVEMTPLSDEEEAEAAKPRQYQIVLGEGQALPDVESAIQTLTPGDEGEFSVEITPEAEEGEEAEPEDHRVRIRLLEAKRPEYPELDDDFAQSLGDFEDLESLKTRIREDLEQEAEREAERQVRGELMDRIIEANPMEVPDSMVDQYLDRALQPQQGADPEQLKEIREASRPTAERAIKRMLIVERVAETEGLKATETEVDARVEALAEQYDRSPGEIWAELQKSGQLQALEDDITEEKVFEFLKSKSTIK